MYFGGTNDSDSRTHYVHKCLRRPFCYLWIMQLLEQGGLHTWQTLQWQNLSHVKYRHRWWSRGLAGLSLKAFMQSLWKLSTAFNPHTKNRDERIYMGMTAFLMQHQWYRLCSDLLWDRFRRSKELPLCKIVFNFFFRLGHTQLKEHKSTRFRDSISSRFNYSFWFVSFLSRLSLGEGTQGGAI